MFEKCNPGNNVFLCMVPKGHKMRYVNETSGIIISGTEQEKSILKDSIDKIFIHYLTIEKIRFIYDHHFQSKIIVWIIWGGDLYNSMLKRRGYRLYSDNNSCLNYPMDYASSRIYEKLKWLGLFSKPIVRLANRLHESFDDRMKVGFLKNCVDYIVSVKPDFSLITDAVRMRRLKGRLDFSYYPIEDTIGQLVGKWSDGHNIMVGNCATYSNNHEYVLEYLKSLDLKGFSVILPLSYGGSPKYIDAIKKKYSVLQSVKILENYLPIDEYYSIIASATTCIYGNFRQEAWGNILIALYLGSKVYLSRNSPLLQMSFYMGIKVFELESIKDTFEYQLTKEERVHNRQVVMDNYSREKNIEYINTLCNL